MPVISVINLAYLNVSNLKLCGSFSPLSVCAFCPSFSPVLVLSSSTHVGTVPRDAVTLGPASAPSTSMSPLQASMHNDTDTGLLVCSQKAKIQNKHKTQVKYSAKKVWQQGRIVSSSGFYDLKTQQRCKTLKHNKCKQNTEQT